jgi:hypothetical protein
MRYMIYDCDGEAVGAYRSRRAAEFALRAMVTADPDYADDLVLLGYDKTGRSTGDGVRASELPPLASVQETQWVVPVTTVAQRGMRVLPRRNRYIPRISGVAPIRFENRDAASR